MDSGEEIKLEIKRIYTYSAINNYSFNHEKWRYFQFDCYNKPGDFKEEYVEEEYFRGYLIGKRVNKKSVIEECQIKIILDK